MVLSRINFFLCRCILLPCFLIPHVPAFAETLSSGLPQAEERPDGFCTMDGPWVLDPKGRTLLLRGVNYSGAAKSKDLGFLPWQNEEETKIIREWGFNSVRYLIFWEAVEPEPGVYDEEYLDKVEERLRWLREAGLWVILDMHQDLYARKYGGDGAPEWACLHDGIPFVPQPGGWFMNYPTPAVMRCFDNFWANKEGPGGVGILDRYVAVWQHVARRFREDNNIIGYDVMNEPFYGSSVVGIFLDVLLALRAELGEDFHPLLAEVRAGSTHGEDPIVKTVKRLIEEDKLFPVMDRASWVSKRFEVKVLQDFYNRMARGIREVDPHHAIIFESAGGGAAGTRLLTAIDVPRDGQGQAFPHVIFSPHHYEFAADFGFEYDPAWKSVRTGLYRGYEASQKMHVPIWYGEWGAWTGIKPGTVEMIREHLDTFDEMLCGWAYWDYGSRGFKDCPLLSMLGRPYAEVVAGRPTRMVCEESRLILEFESTPDGGETVLWVPPRVDVEVKTESQELFGIETSRDETGRVWVICPAGGGSCEVTVSWNDTYSWIP